MLNRAKGLMCTFLAAFFTLVAVASVQACPLIIYQPELPQKK